MSQISTTIIFFFPYTIYNFILWNIIEKKTKLYALDDTVKLLEIIDYLPHLISHLAISGQRRRQTTPKRATRVLILGSSTVAIPSDFRVKAHYLGCVQREDFEFESASMNFGARFWNSAFSVLLQRPHPLPRERTLYVNILYKDLRLHHFGAMK